MQLSGLGLFRAYAVGSRAYGFKVRVQGFDRV